MIINHLLCQLSYPRMVSNWTGSTLPFVWRNTGLQCSRASRVSLSPDTWPSEGTPHVIEIMLRGKRNDAHPTEKTRACENKAGERDRADTGFDATAPE